MLTVERSPSITVVYPKHLYTAAEAYDIDASIRAFTAAMCWPYPRTNNLYGCFVYATGYRRERSQKGRSSFVHRFRAYWLGAFTWRDLLGPEWVFDDRANGSGLFISATYGKTRAA
jgi:hypothetical protein